MAVAHRPLREEHCLASAPHSKPPWAEEEGRVEIDLTACEAEDQPGGSTRPTPVPKDQKRLLEVSLATWDPEGGRYVMDIHLASALNHLATCGLKRRAEWSPMPRTVRPKARQDDE